MVSGLSACFLPAPGLLWFASGLLRLVLLRAGFAHKRGGFATLARFWLASGLLLVCFCFALACLLLAYVRAQARRFLHVPFAPGLLLACSLPALSGLCLACFWPFFCTGAVVSARLACSVWPASGPLCLACVVWVWPAVPGPWPENRPFLIEPRKECLLFPTKVWLPGLFLDSYPCNLQRI